MSYSEQVRDLISKSLAESGYKPNDIGSETPTEFLAELHIRRAYTHRARVAIVNSIISKLNLENTHILEIGSGLGDLYNLINATGKNVSITLADKDDKRTREHTQNQVDVIKLDINNLELPDNSQQAIIITNLLDQIDDAKRPISEIKRVLKPEGRIIVLTDLLPDEFVFYSQHRKKIILPIGDHKPGIVPYITFSLKQAIEFGNLQPPHLKEFWHAYRKLKRPWERAIIARSTNDHMHFLYKNLLNLVSRNMLSFDPQITDSAKDFHTRTAQKIESVGFQNIQNLLINEVASGYPLGLQQPGYSYTFSFSSLYKNPQPILGEQVQETAYFGIVVGEK